MNSRTPRQVTRVVGIPAKRIASRPSRPSRPSFRKVGVTNPNFAVPSGLDSTTASAALVTAASTFASYLASNGVPSEHAYDAATAAFQTAWNEDPLVAVNITATLDIDGGYGSNTHDALAAINGSAPDVNTASAPPGSTPAGPAPAPPATPTSPSSNANVFAGMPEWGLWLVGLAAVGGAYFVGKSALEKHGPKAMGHARRAHAQLRHHAARLAHRHR